MADAVQTNVIFQGGFRYSIKMTNISDGTGESAVTKIDISTLLLTNGLPCGRLAVEEIEWDVHGFNYVKLYFDRTSPYTAQVCSGRGAVSWKHLGYAFDKGTGGTGDLLLTTNGAAAGNTYDITIVVQLRQS